MAKLVDLTNLTTPALNDLAYIVDVSDQTHGTDGTNKKMPVSAIATFLDANSSTLTNKTISLTNNTLTGTIAEFNAALSNADFATLTGSETLTNKTLTSPVIDKIINGDGETLLNFESAIGTNVNYVTIANSVTANPVGIKAEGTDTNISLVLRIKGDSAFYVTDEQDNTAFNVSVFTNGANYLTAFNAPSGNDPELRAEGDDDDIDLRITSKGIGSVRLVNSWDGWVETKDITFVFDAWDDTGGISKAQIDVTDGPDDLADIFTAGMRLKFNQSTGGTKMGIITNVSTGELTLLLHKDHTLNDEDISSVYYSPVSIPHGFDLNPLNWTITNIDTSNRAVSNPINGQWYNVGTTNNQLILPFGLWVVSYDVGVKVQNTADTFVGGNVSLSTDDDSETIATMTAGFGAGGASGTIISRQTVTKSGLIDVSSATQTFYLIAQSNSGGTVLEFLGSTLGPTIIRAVCAYL